MIKVMCKHGLQGHRTDCQDCMFQVPVILAGAYTEDMADVWDNWILTRVNCNNNKILVKVDANQVVFAPI